MKIYVRNKLISIGDGSEVFDENKNVRFRVKGNIVTLTNKKRIYDDDGNLVYRVRNKFWHLMKKSAYVCDPSGKIIMQLREKSAILGKGFDVLRADENYRIEWGGFATGCNKIFKDEDLVCVIKRKIFSLVDYFELDFEREEDASLFVAMTIAIDNIYDTSSD